jgi:hypothetical protein
MPAVDFAIVGAQKAATTALLRYVAQHPSIQVHSTQEMTFFVDDAEWQRGWEDARRRYGLRDADRMIGVKAAAMMNDPEAVMRLAEHSPSAQIAVVLRNPVERAYSAFWYCRSRGLEPCADFDEAVWARPERFGDDRVARIACDYLGNSSYAAPIRQLQHTFGSERVHLLRNEDLRGGPAATDGILQSLGLDPAERASGSVNVNRATRARSQRLAAVLASRGRARSLLRAALPIEARRRIRNSVRGLNRVEFRPPPMNPRTHELLVAHFTPDIDEVQKLTGWDLSEWKNAGP